MKVLSIILGVLLVVGGLYCMFTPVATYSALAWLIGLAMVVEGIGDIIMWNSWRKEGLANGWTLAGAIISLVLGVFLLGSYAAQFAVDLFIAYLIAIWLFFSGITRIVAAFSLRNYQKQVGATANQPSWVALLVLGILVVILGILCIFNPLAIMAGVGFMLGLSIVFTGIGTIVIGTQM